LRRGHRPAGTGEARVGERGGGGDHPRRTAKKKLAAESFTIPTGPFNALEKTPKRERGGCLRTRPQKGRRHDWQQKPDGEEKKVPGRGHPNNPPRKSVLNF